MSAAELGPNVRIYSDSHTASQAATDWLVEQLVIPTNKNVMLAGGNTPVGLYAEVAERRPDVSHVKLFALDEYVGVPLEEPRNCANLIRTTAVEPWGIDASHYHWISSIEDEAQASIEAHEQKIRTAGGLDLVILGLGRNGHIGFNEPGSAADSAGRVIDLDAVSIEANREWFNGEYAPRLGVTTGLRLILEAKQILLLAFGAAKAQAVQSMLQAPASSDCPASLLQHHRNVVFVLDKAAAAELQQMVPVANGQ